MQKFINQQLTEYTFPWLQNSDYEKVVIVKQ